MSNVRIFEITQSLYNKVKDSTRDVFGDEKVTVDFSCQLYHESEIFLSLVEFETRYDNDGKVTRCLMGTTVEGCMSINFMFTSFDSLLHSLYPNSLHEIPTEILTTFGFSLPFNECSGDAYMYKCRGKLYIVILEHSVDCDKFFTPLILNNDKNMHKIVEFLAL